MTSKLMTTPLDAVAPLQCDTVGLAPTLAFPIGAKSAVPQHAMRLARAAAERAIQCEAKPMTEQQIQDVFSK